MLVYLLFAQNSCVPADAKLSCSAVLVLVLCFVWGVMETHVKGNTA